MVLVGTICGAPGVAQVLEQLFWASSSIQFRFRER
jgi:hypothetical protein